MYTEQFTEVHDILAELAPTTAHGLVGAHVTGYADMADYHRAFVWLHIGEPGQGATITVTIQEAQDALGTGAQALMNIAAVPGSKSPAVIVAADSGEYVGIEIRSPELDVSNGYHFIQVTVTVGVAAYTYSCVLFGIVSRYEPVGVTDFLQVVP